MNNTKKAFRLIVIRRPYQSPLFEEGQEKHTVIATNRTESAEKVVGWYNQRGECSENRIKELKIGFGMERMPCGQFKANALFFRIGVIAYNIGRLFVLRTLVRSWHRHQVQTLRWKLYATAGKIVFRGRSVYLKVRRAPAHTVRRNTRKDMVVCVRMKKSVRLVKWSRGRVYPNFLKINVGHFIGGCLMSR